MRAVLKPCWVEVDGQGRPYRLRWRHQVCRVTRVILRWRIGGRWWLGEPARTCWRLQCGAFRVVVHQFDPTSPPSPLQGWWVVRVQD